MFIRRFTTMNKQQLVEKMLEEAHRIEKVGDHFIEKGDYALSAIDYSISRAWIMAARLVEEELD